MIPSIASILDDLRPCFSRQAAFEWFVIIIFGLIIRCDHLGITSIVRWLFLSPDCYDLILHFFRATSWQLDSLLAGVIAPFPKMYDSKDPFPEF